MEASKQVADKKQVLSGFKRMDRFYQLSGFMPCWFQLHFHKVLQGVVNGVVIIFRSKNNLCFSD